METIKKIFFFHNPKAGGTSIQQILLNLGLRSYAPIIENNMVEHQELNGDYKAFKGYYCYMGHYGRDIFSVVNDNHLCMTSFRHPITRVLSLYNFFRFTVQLSEQKLSTEKYFAVRLAKTVDLKTFVSMNDPRVDVYIQNAHFRQLTNSGWSLCMTGSLMQAFDFIDQMAFYYVCEHPQESLNWFKKTMGMDISLFPRVNITSSQSEKIVDLKNIDDNTLAEIYSKNTFDLALHDYAVNHLLNKIS